MTDLSRRSVLRRAATGFAGITAAAGTASATGGDSGRDEGRDLPISGGVTTRQMDHPDMPDPYDYVTSIETADLCYWSGSACIFAAFGGLLWSLFGGFAVGGACKIVQGAGCRLRRDVKRLTPYDFDWVHVYQNTLPSMVRLGSTANAAEYVFIPQP